MVFPHNEHICFFLMSTNWTIHPKQLLYISHIDEDIFYVTFFKSILVFQMVSSPQIVKLEEWHHEYSDDWVGYVLIMLDYKNCPFWSHHHYLTRLLLFCLCFKLFGESPNNDLRHCNNTQVTYTYQGLLQQWFELDNG